MAKKAVGKMLVKLTTALAIIDDGFAHSKRNKWVAKCIVNQS